MDFLPIDFALFSSYNLRNPQGGLLELKENFATYKHIPQKFTNWILISKFELEICLSN